MLRRLLASTFLLALFVSTFSISLTQLMLGVSALLGIVVVIRERRLPFSVGMRPVWAAIGLYLTWLIAVSIYQDEALRSLNHIREEWLFIVMPLGLLVLTGDRAREKVVPVLSAGLLMISLGSLLMYLFGYQYSWHDGFTPLLESNPRVRGNFTHALTFGNYTAVASAFVVAWALKAGEATGRATRRLAFAAGFFGTVAVLLCGSRGPVLALIVGGVVLLFTITSGRRRWLVGALVALVIIGAALPSVRSRFGRELGWHFNTEWPGGRLFIWERSLEIIAEHPFTGVGPGNFAEAYKQALPADVTDRYWYGHAHNDFLQAAARSGLLGMLLFANLWVAMARVYRAVRKRAGPVRMAAETVAFLVGSVVFLVASLTEATFSDEEVRVLLMVVWSVGLTALYKAEKDGQPVAAG